MSVKTNKGTKSDWKLMEQFGVFVHPDGWVKTARNGKIRKIFLNEQGSVCINLPFNLGDEVITSSDTCTLGRLICYTFNGPPPTGMKTPRAYHRNGNVFDNRAENLVWASPKEIGQDLLLAGKFATKLSIDQVRYAKWIYTYLNDGPVDMNALAKTFGVSQHHMYVTLKHGAHWDNEFTDITRRMKVPGVLIDTYRAFREENTLYEADLEEALQALQELQELQAS